jgi:hypothetical protein
MGTPKSRKSIPFGFFICRHIRSRPAKTTGPGSFYTSFMHNRSELLQTHDCARGGDANALTQTKP